MSPSSPDPVQSAAAAMSPSTRSGWLARIVGALGHWQQRAHDRRALAGLSERDLRDLGLTREVIEHEVGKPFRQR